MLESTGPSRRRRWRGIREPIMSGHDQQASKWVLQVEKTHLGLNHLKFRAVFHLVECRLAVATGPGKRVPFLVSEHGFADG